MVYWGNRSFSILLFFSKAMPKRTITLTFTPSQTFNTINLDGIDTTYRIELREFIVNGVQGTDVGQVINLRLRDGSDGNSFVTESFQQIRETATNIGPNQNELSATNAGDIPLYLTSSPTTYQEYNYPRVLVENRAVPSTKYALVPKLVFKNGITPPVFTSCTITLVLSWGPNNQSTNNYNTIKRAFYNG